MDNDSTPVKGRSARRKRQFILLSVGVVVLVGAAVAVAVVLGVSGQQSGSLTTASAVKVNDTLSIGSSQVKVTSGATRGTEFVGSGKLLAGPGTDELSATVLTRLHATSCNIASHSGEDKSVEWRDSPPVRMTHEAMRDERRALSHQSAAVRRGLEHKLQPRQTRHTHLGSKSQQPRFDSLLNPPKVDRVTNEQRVGVSTSPTQAHTSDKSINSPSDLPQELGRKPAVVSANSLQGLPDLLGGEF